MDYGDEANDDEEARYAKEFEGSDAEEDEAGEYEQDSIKVVPLARDFERRGNRGQRMNALVGKAQEDDDAFWGGIGNDFFGEAAEESEDKDFNSGDEEES